MAVRKHLIDEIRKVYDFADAKVDIRHVRLVVDYMLREGEVTGYTRHDVSEKTDVFLKAAAFEETLTTVRQAGVKKQANLIRGVSENVILSRLGSIGPGVCESLMNLGVKDDDNDGDGVHVHGAKEGGDDVDGDGDMGAREDTQQHTFSSVTPHTMSHTREMQNSVRASARYCTSEKDYTSFAHQFTHGDTTWSGSSEWT